jgi:hypothetical protein
MIRRVLRRNVAAELRAVEIDFHLSLSDLRGGGYYLMSERQNSFTRPRAVSMT